MINGGFHAEKVTEELKKRNITYLSIQPRMTRTDVINPYFQLLRNRQTPLEKMLAKNQTILSVMNRYQMMEKPEFANLRAALGTSLAALASRFKPKSVESTMAEIGSRYDIEHWRFVDASTLPNPPKGTLLIDPNINGHEVLILISLGRSLDDYGLTNRLIRQHGIDSEKPYWAVIPSHQAWRAVQPELKQPTSSLSTVRSLLSSQLFGKIALATLAASLLLYGISALIRSSSLIDTVLAAGMSQPIIITAVMAVLLIWLSMRWLGLDLARISNSNVPVKMSEAERAVFMATIEANQYEEPVLANRNADWGPQLTSPALVRWIGRQAERFGWQPELKTMKFLARQIENSTLVGIMSASLAPLVILLTFGTAIAWPAAVFAVALVLSAGILIAGLFAVRYIMRAWHEEIYDSEDSEQSHSANSGELDKVGEQFVVMAGVFVAATLLIGTISVVLNDPVNNYLSNNKYMSYAVAGLLNAVMIATIHEARSNWTNLRRFISRLNLNPLQGGENLENTITYMFLPIWVVLLLLPSLKIKKQARSVISEVVLRLNTLLHKATLWEFLMKAGLIIAALIGIKQLDLYYGPFSDLGFFTFFFAIGMFVNLLFRFLKNSYGRQLLKTIQNWKAPVIGMILWGWYSPIKSDSSEMMIQNLSKNISLLEKIKALWERQAQQRVEVIQTAGLETSAHLLAKQFLSLIRTSLARLILTLRPTNMEQSGHEGLARKKTVFGLALTIMRNIIIAIVLTIAGILLVSMLHSDSWNQVGIPGNGSIVVESEQTNNNQQDVSQPESAPKSAVVQSEAVKPQSGQDHASPPRSEEPNHYEIPVSADSTQSPHTLPVQVFQKRISALDMTMEINPKWTDVDPKEFQGFNDLAMHYFRDFKLYSNSMRNRIIEMIKADNGHQSYDNLTTVRLRPVVNLIYKNGFRIKRTEDLYLAELTATNSVTTWPQIWIGTQIAKIGLGMYSKYLENNIWPFWQTQQTLQPSQQSARTPAPQLTSPRLVCWVEKQAARIGWHPELNTLKFLARQIENTTTITISGLSVAPLMGLVIIGAASMPLWIYVGAVILSGLLIAAGIRLVRDLMRHWHTTVFDASDLATTHRANKAELQEVGRQFTLMAAATAVGILSVGAVGFLLVDQTKAALPFMLAGAIMAVINTIYHELHSRRVSLPALAQVGPASFKPNDFLSSRFFKHENRITDLLRPLQIGLIQSRLGLLSVVDGLSGKTPAEVKMDDPSALMHFAANHYYQESDIELQDGKREATMLNQLNQALRQIRLSPFAYRWFAQSLQDHQSGTSRAYWANRLVGLMIEQNRAQQNHRKFHLPPQAVLARAMPEVARQWFKRSLRSRAFAGLFRWLHSAYPLAAQELLLGQLPMQARSPRILKALRTDPTLSRAYLQSIIGRTQAQRDQGVINLEIGLRRIIEQQDERSDLPALIQSLFCYNELFRAMKVRKVVIGRLTPSMRSASLSQTFCMPEAADQASAGHAGQLMDILRRIKKNDIPVWIIIDHRREKGLAHRLGRSVRRAI